MEEEWRDIPGYEGKYRVSNYGKLFSIKRNIHMKTYISTWGYSSCYLYNKGKVKTYFVHRLVMLAFVGSSDLPVNHINRIKTDNDIRNLEYISVRENASHKFDRNFIGTAWVKALGRWQSAIHVNGKKILLGFFDDRQKAHEAYMEYVRSNGIENKYAGREQ